MPLTAGCCAAGAHCRSACATADGGRPLTLVHTATGPCARAICLCAAPAANALRCYCARAPEGSRLRVSSTDLDPLLLAALQQAATRILPCRLVTTLMSTRVGLRAWNANNGARMWAGAQPYSAPEWCQERALNATTHVY